MGRIVRPVDFQRVLGTPPWARSIHFAVHHLAQSPTRPRWDAAKKSKLSTDSEHDCPQVVDEAPAKAPEAVSLAAPTDCWLGMVVPKRHAKRSVTRTLLKRQIRAAVGLSATPPRGLSPGLWVVRLRAPIDRKLYPSAASDALRLAVRQELRRMMDQALQRCHG